MTDVTGTVITLVMVVILVTETVIHVVTQVVQCTMGLPVKVLVTLAILVKVITVQVQQMRVSPAINVKVITVRKVMRVSPAINVSPAIQLVRLVVTMSAKVVIVDVIRLATPDVTTVKVM